MDRVVTCPCAICATRFVRLRLGDDNNSLRNRMVADAAASSLVDNISRRNNDGKTSTGPFPRRHHPFDDVTFLTPTPGQLMSQLPPRTQVVRPSLSGYPIELGRGEANPGSMDSSSSMPRGSFDPGPRDYFMVASSDTSATRSSVPATLQEVASSQLYGRARRHGGGEIRNTGFPPMPSLPPSWATKTSPPVSANILAINSERI